MKRKVIQIANSTQLVSLPRKWSLDNNVKKGDELEVEIKENTLLISTSAHKSETRSITFDVSGLYNRCKRVIGALYRAGFDEMTIQYSNVDELRYIQEIIHEGCIGFELIDQGSNYVVLKKVSEIIEQEFEHVLKRMTLYLLTMSKESLRAIESMDQKQLAYVIKMDSSINKFTDFCVRILSISQNKLGFSMADILLEIERIGDEYKALTRYVKERNVKPSASTMTAIRETNEYLELLYDLLFKFSIPHLKKMYVRAERLRKILEISPAESLKKDAKIYFYLENIVNNLDSVETPILMNYALANKSENFKAG